jgi:chromosome segregation ATPase
MESQLKSKDKMVDRLRNENKTLSDAVKESQRKNEQYEADLLELDEIVERLSDENKDWQVSRSDLEDAVKVLSDERQDLSSQVAELDAQVAQRMDLLEQFEARFREQFTAWEEQLKQITDQLESAHKQPTAAGGDLVGRGHHYPHIPPPPPI